MNALSLFSNVSLTIIFTPKCSRDLTGINKTLCRCRDLFAKSYLKKLGLIEQFGKDCMELN